MVEINTKLVEFICVHLCGDEGGVFMLNADVIALSQYEGEIQVLYQVTIIPTLTSKKWANKELAVKAGERVDVISKAEDDRLICRSEEGKCE